MTHKMNAFSRSSITPKALLIGNGLNLLDASTCGVSWDSLLESLEKKYRSDIDRDLGDEGEAKGDLPFLFRAERLFYWEREASTEDDVDTATSLKEDWKEWHKKLALLEPGEIHHLIAKNSNIFDNILTTNYDYCIEKSLNIEIHQNISSKNQSLGLNSNMRRYHGKVWHIHGEANDYNNIVMRHESYIESIPCLQKSFEDFENGKTQKNPTWLDIFLNSDVYICGLNIRYEEYLLWFAFHKRFNLSKEQRKDVVVYLFCRQDKDEQSSKDLSSVLKALAITPVTITVSKDRRTGDYDFNMAWKALLGDMILKLNENKTQQKDNSQLPKFRKSWIKCNIVSSSKVTENNSSRCWANIAVDKLDDPRLEGKHWIFDCFVKGQRYVYSCPISNLREAFLFQNVSIIENNPRRYNFYIDPYAGKLYASISSSNKSEIICLDEILSENEYNKKMVSLR